jgi:GMP synthase (glutamine-hydrolysing)
MTDSKPGKIPEGGHRIATSGDIEVSTYLEIAKEIAGEQSVAATEAATPAEREAIIVIDFGSQYNLLIARRIRELNVYCELVPHDTPWEKIAHLNPKGFILSGYLLRNAGYHQTVGRPSGERCQAGVRPCRASFQRR